MRLGAIAAFSSMADLEAQVEWLNSLFENSSHDTEPINVLNIVLRLDAELHDHNDDEALQKLLSEFIVRHRDDFYSVQIRRITFIMTKKGTFPKYFTFRERLGFLEDAIYRHVDPALAFKLEMFRLANYDVQHCPTRNPHLHLYYATASGNNPRFRHDRRFFARTIMRNPDLVSKEATIELMQDAGERLLVEALDEMEVKFSDRKTYGPTDCNHVFINFVPVVEMDPVAYSKELEKMIRRYGERLWQLRVLEAEIRMNVRMQRNTRDIPIRFVVSNVSGYYLNIHIYKEVRRHCGGKERGEEERATGRRKGERGKRTEERGKGKGERGKGKWERGKAKGERGKGKGERRKRKGGVGMVSGFGCSVWRSWVCFMDTCMVSNQSTDGGNNTCTPHSEPL